MIATAQEGLQHVANTATDGHDAVSIARGGAQNDALLVLLPLLIVLSTLLFLLLIFLIFVLLFRRRRSIILSDRNGPVDMSREDFSGADGGFEGLEQRWLEGVSEMERHQYHRVKGRSSPHIAQPLLIPRRIPAAIPAEFVGDGHHAISVFDDPRKGRFGLVI